MTIIKKEHSSVESLNALFALTETDNTLIFKNGRGDIPVIEIKNCYASAMISLQGAHLLSWIPAGEEEVIWLSEHASFATGKSVRGGVPICWPWFGAHVSNEAFPAHGFARTTLWQVLSIEALIDGGTCICFSMMPEGDNADMWPAETTVQFQLTIGKKLQLELLTHNNGSQAITIVRLCIHILMWLTFLIFYCMVWMIPIILINLTASNVNTKRVPSILNRKSIEFILIQPVTALLKIKY